jgi:segregation and condensation protein B
MTAARSDRGSQGEENQPDAPLANPSAQEGLSLNQLSEAFASMLRSGDDPYGPDESAEPAPDSEAAAEQPDDSPVNPRTILEAMLFVGSPQNEPLTSRQVAGLMRGVRPAEIDALVRELNRDYASRNCPYTIASEGPGYRLKLRDELDRMRDKFYGRARQARLSQAAIEVLAAVAYHAPITADEVSRMRGMPSGHLLLQLVRRRLLRVERDPSTPRRANYYTTERFLELFSLASVDELPRSQDLEEAAVGRGPS